MLVGIAKGYIITFLIISLLFGLDDLIFDLYFYIRSFKRNKKHIKVKDLNTVTPQSIAIIIAAWKEENVIADMLYNTLTTINYPAAFFHLFVAVYPNDLATQKAIEPLLETYSNLHMIINGVNGPTTKANNINYAYKHGLDKYERQSGMQFDIIAIHDAEDIIHPTSLKLINYLIPKHQVVQLPVFPLQPYPTFRNFFKFITSGTYADEFAENHYRTMVAREIGQFIVPSAGTGFFMSRAAIKKVENTRGFLLNETSLTEDYELSVYMQKIGIDVHYFLEKIERVSKTGKIVREYIATREFFPNTLHEAVKQKARWIYGISFQSKKQINLKDYTKYQRYSLQRDWRAKYANISIIPCYTILLYVIASYFIKLPNIIPYKSLSWYLSLIMTGMAIERQLMRAIALKMVYGWRSAILSNYFPPIIPIRFTWGNIINLLATVRAWRTHLFGTKASKAKWAKTDHTYLPKDILDGYRRKLGDLLLEKELITTKELKYTLDKIEAKQKRLGDALIEGGILLEDQLSPVLAELWGITYLDEVVHLVNPKLARVFPLKLVSKLEVVPLLKFEKQILIASYKILSKSDKQEIIDKTELEPLIVLTSPFKIQRAIHNMYKEDYRKLASNARRLGEILIDEGLISMDQLMQAFKYQILTGKRLGETLIKLGIITEEKLNKILETNEVELENEYKLA